MTQRKTTTNKKLKGYLSISVRLEPKGAYYFRDWKAFNFFMNRLIAVINLEKALNKPTEYPKPYIYQRATNGVGQPLMPKKIKKAINNPIIL